jgi:hypothetical protein
VTHRNAENEVVARFVEVCRFPEILQAQPEDIQNSVEVLTQKLSASAQNGQTPAGEVRETAT